MEALANDASVYISRAVAPVVTPEPIGSDFSGSDFRAKFFRVQAEGFGTSSVLDPRYQSGANIDQITVGLSDQEIIIPVRKKQIPIDRVKRDKMSPKGIQSFEGQIAAPALTDRFMLIQEARLASLISTGSNWTNTAAGSSASTYWDSPTCDVTQILAKMAASPLKYGKKVTTLVLGWAAFFALKQNPAFKSLGGDSAMGFTPQQTSSLLSELLSINAGPNAQKIEVYILGASQNTAALGQTASNSFINSNFAWMGHIPPADQASLYTRSALYSFESDPFTLIEDQDGRTDQYLYTARHVCEIAIVEPALGFCYTTPVQTPANFGG